eukprot:TRINITY_DN5200_c0_g1_i1.p1 TRINITY_DN5200_c0_g1~~TRINITY_DN5200_c0_g1_i1.p1  ORF type:complete len:130 (-),score=8.45 TRINITY_DN5200_c0_g1_i1:52-441(-)
MFLHLFHHATTASIVWVTWVNPISGFYLGPVTNSFVHTIMYGYYFLVEFNLVNRSFGGKWITPIQLVQFLICLFACSYEIFFREKCNGHTPTQIWIYFLYFVFFCFFVKVYVDKKAERHAQRPAAKKVE